VFFSAIVLVTILCQMFKYYRDLYESLSEIFRTDAVKITKLPIRPIGRHHLRSSSLPHVDTGPTACSIFGRLPEGPFLLEGEAHSAIRPSQWYQNGVISASILFLEIGQSHRVPDQGSTVGEGWQPFLFRQKLLGEVENVRRDVVMVEQPGVFSPKFGATSSHVFTQSTQNVAVEPGIHSLSCWDRCFALTQLLYKWRHHSGIFWIPPRK
jgi:hypothetical protein